MYDLVIRNGRIIDGTGSPWYAGDVGIRDGRIAAIGALDGAAARQTIDAAGMVVAPGFIDMLGQSELTHPGQPPASRPRSFRASPPRSPARAARAGPLNDSIIAADRAGYDHYKITPDWRTLGGVLRPAGAAGHRDQLRELRRGDPGAPDGAGRRRPDADAGGARTA